MAIKSGKDIYNVLEKHLRAAAYPRAAAGKVGFTITEIDDGVLLEFQKFTVMIKSKT